MADTEMPQWMALLMMEGTMVDAYRAPSGPGCPDLSLPARRGLWHFDGTHGVGGDNKPPLRCLRWSGLRPPSCDFTSATAALLKLLNAVITLSPPAGKLTFSTGVGFGGKCWLALGHWAGMWQWCGGRCGPDSRLLSTRQSFRTAVALCNKT